MTSRTAFEKVKEFNRAFGIEVPDEPVSHLGEVKPSILTLKMKLIKEEVQELWDAVATDNLVETVDALSDIVYVVYGMGIALGVDLDHAFHRVHESNMSKLCSSQSEAEDTVKWYQEKFKAGELPYDQPVWRVQNGRYIVLNESTGKVLKSIHYHPVDLTPVLEKKKMISASSFT